jgi:SAM-dependent methyltransferase
LRLDVAGRNLPKAWLAHPLTRGLDLNDPRLNAQRRRIIEQKPFLRRIYEEWYTAIVEALPPGDAPVLEIGSGAGFLRDFIPRLITSDVLPSSGVRVVLDGTLLPFAGETLRAVVMTNVLHHLTQPRRFFAEAGRCVRREGAIVMIEPWVSSWSRIVYGRLHHEPFEPEAQAWETPPTGPLSGANGALPWMLFFRDRSRFEREFPMWSVESIRLGMPFRYIVSGGISMRTLVPCFSFGVWRRAELLMEPWMSRWAMFARITLRRQG